MKYIYITGADTYSISGALSNGKIIVNQSDENATIELELTGVNISCNYGTLSTSSSSTTSLELVKGLYYIA